MDGNTTHILLVEDELAHAELIRRVFGSDGGRVKLSVVPSLGQARARIAESTPDLVIVDLRLPDGNGIEILPADKEEVAFPVVVLTAHGDEQAAVEAMKRGALDYVVKSEATLAEVSHIARRTLREWGQIVQRKRAEAALRDSEERYRHIFDRSPLGIGLTTPDGKVVTCNKAVETITGYSIEELKQIDLADLYAHGEDRKRLVDAISGNDGVAAFPVRMKRKDGTLYDALLDVSKISLEGRDYLHTILQDVTERKRVEEALRESEEKFRTLVHNLGEGVTIVDEKQRFLFSNRAAEQILGVEPGDLVGRSLTDFVRVEALPLVQDQIDKRRRGVTSRYELEMVRPDGENRQVLVSGCPRFSHDRTFAGALASFCDITERKRAEEVLRESEQKYRALVEGSLQGIVVLRDFHILFANRAAAEITGLSTDELLALSREKSQAFIPPEDRAVLFQRLKDRLAGKPVRARNEYRLVRKDGSVFWLHTFVSPIQYEGEPALQVAFVDITERKQAEQALKEAHDELGRRVEERTAELVKANEQLKQEIEERRRAEEALRRAERLASIGTLAAGIAHEINNPLGAIGLYAKIGQLCKDRPDIQETPETCLVNIQEQVLRCSQIVKSVLKFARAQESEKRPGDLGSVARRARVLTRGLAAQKQVEVLLEPGRELPEIVMNQTEMEQVFVNLISNAVEASGPGSRVTVRLEPDTDSIRVLVRDRGRGMTAEEAGRAFDPFYTTRQQEGGTGLGLSITYGIVEQHGGTIDLQSKPGEGTTVRLLLPAKPTGE